MAGPLWKAIFINMPVFFVVAAGPNCRLLKFDWALENTITIMIIKQPG